MFHRRKYHVFISYRHKDGKERASLVLRILEKKIPSRKIFLDVGSLSAGDYSYKLKKALSDSKYMVLLITPCSFETRKGRDFYLEGIEFALENKIPIIPVLFTEWELSEEHLPPILKGKSFLLQQQIRYNHEYEAAFEEKLRSYVAIGNPLW